MALKLKSGLIYFLREKELGGAGFTDYCKIGLVANDRTTSQRIKEHQTGNPREIVEAVSVTTNAVTSLESYLHERFALHRISGEWFRLSEDDFELATKEAQDVAAKLDSQGQVLEAGAALKKLESVDPARPPSEVEIELHASAVAIHRKLLNLGTEMDIIQLELCEQMGARPGIDGVIDMIFPQKSVVFDSKAFEREHPDLFKRFLSPQPDRFSARFKLKGKPSKRELDVELKDRLKELNEALAEFDTDVSLEPLNGSDTAIAALQRRYLELLSEVSRHRLLADIKEAELQACCGTASGIDGVCDWRREHLPAAAKLNEEGLQRDHPDIYQTFLQEKQSSPRISLKPYRPTQGAADRYD